MPCQEICLRGAEKEENKGKGNKEEKVGNKGKKEEGAKEKARGLATRQSRGRGQQEKTTDSGENAMGTQRKHGEGAGVRAGQ